MSRISQNNATEHASRPPALRRDAQGRIEPSSLADVIEWFLNYDQRVAIVNSPAVESLFQWKQQQNLLEDASAYTFARAEDRLAVGIMQALKEHESEPQLHAWIKQLLGALDDASKTNEEISGAYGIHPSEDAPVIAEAGKIPARSERALYLTCCWLETLCTAEIRVLGWLYQELYNRPFHPGNF